MRRQSLFVAVVAASLLVGCNQPAVSPKPPAFQSSENTVRDWNDVAHHIAAEMARLSLVPSYPTEQPQLANAPSPKPIFIQKQAVDCAFIQQVADELAADILQRGGMVARSPSGATVVNLDVNFIQWGPRDKPPGLAFTTLGVLSIPGIVMNAASPMSIWTAANAAAFTSLGVGAFLDTVIALTPTMNAEAVWKATIQTEDRTVMNLQEPVYIRSSDIPLYAKATSVNPVSSWRPNYSLHPRSIRYDP